MWCPSLGTQLLFMGIDKVLWQELALRAMIHTSTVHTPCWGVLTEIMKCAVQSWQQEWQGLRRTGDRNGASCFSPAFTPRSCAGPALSDLLCVFNAKLQISCFIFSLWLIPVFKYWWLIIFNWIKIHIKLTLLIIFKCTILSHFIHTECTTVWNTFTLFYHPSSELFSSCTTETPRPWDSHSLVPPPPAAGNLPALSVSVTFTTLGTLM